MLERMPNSRFIYSVILVIMSFVTTKAFPQTATLMGTVSDAETGEFLPGANVVVTSPELQTGTAVLSTGVFEFKRLPAGTYTITVSYIGYEKKILTDFVLNPGESKALDISLNPTGIQVNPVTVTASRRPEKLLDAPASITVLEAQAIEARTALTAAEHLKALPAVDLFSTGLNQSRVVIRGFNDLFSGSLLSLVDNRITRIPSIRLNAFQLIPTSNEDVERIEIVSGPASALYGPNSANGVMHVLTKSPFDSKGTTLSVGGGERSVLIGTLRHAGSFHDKIGYKLSVQYYQGNDFESVDSTEVVARQAAMAAGADPDTLKIGSRIFDIESTAVDGRIDFRLSPDFTFILNGGFSKGTNIELTQQGAAQAIDAGFKYIQGRVRYKNLFLQAFLNRINTGNTYFLRTGQSIINNSKLFVIQAQHNLALKERQHFTYGLDVLLTRPDTEGTVNGRNEENDDVDEIGAYLQSETRLSSKLKFVAAARIDRHNRIDGLNFSPRAAFVFKPTPKDNFRVTFNRAFSTPTADNLFSDNLGFSLPTAATDPLLVPFMGETFFNVRALGTWPSGFNFKWADGRPQMVSSFGGYLASNGLIPSPNAYLPANVNPVWPALRDMIISGAPANFKDFLNSILPRQLSETVPAVLAVINPETQEFTPVDDSFVKNIRSAFETTTTTFEVGYRGLIGNKLLASVDVYHSKIKDFIGPLRVETPSVFVNPETLVPVLADDIAANGVPRPFAETIATQIAENLAGLPIGLISPQEVQNGTDIIVTYRNFGDVSVSGVDLSFTYHLNRSWNLSGNYSYVSRDFFESSEGRFDIALNAPKHKFGAMLNYRNSNIGFDGNLRLRFIDGFPVNSGIFVGQVDRYTVVDLNANYKLPFSHSTRLTLTVQNVTNNRHKEFVGVPEIGRLAWVRLTQSL
ncbi:MAG: TonB-dependent receptor domain-containing protein [bacterium]